MKATVDQRGGGHDLVLQGVSICPGIGIARVHVVDPKFSVAPAELVPEQVGAEQERYTAAVETTVRGLREHVATAHGDVTPETKAIMDVHEAVLNDESFHDRVRQSIATNHKNAEWCLWQEANALISQFATMRDSYFRARGEDVRDMAHNLLGALTAGKSMADRRTEKGWGFASRHLHSSDAMLAHRSESAGFASESHALVSHAAILLKGFGIPSVGGLKGLVDTLWEGDRLIVDGTDGVVIVRPAPETLEKYRSRMRAAGPLEKAEPARCSAVDGTEIVIKANIENPEQVPLMHVHGLNGIGLFRTEFLILEDGQIPSEEAQLSAYRSVIKGAEGQPVIVRTFDIGGDKFMGLSSECTGMNPSLGVRGIRRHLVERPDELRTQVRAILRAATGANVGILIPMVTTVEDIIAAKQHVDAVRNELSDAGVAFSLETRLGAMIETPSAAALTAEILAEVDFVSVGTNDLLQYFMAADRDNESVIQYQDPTSPAFLWLMEHIIRQATKAGRDANVTICGEVATDARVLPHLLRMGYRSFSVPPVAAAAFRVVCAGLATEKDKGGASE